MGDTGNLIDSEALHGEMLISGLKLAISYSRPHGTGEWEECLAENCWKFEAC